MNITQTSILNTQKCILLNIGGKVFQTTFFSLVRHENSFFHKLFMSNICFSFDDTQQLFVDRPGDYFSFVLEYLQTNTISVDIYDKNLLNHILDDAKFFQLDGLISLVEGLIGKTCIFSTNLRNVSIIYDSDNIITSITGSLNILRLVYTVYFDKILGTQLNDTNTFKDVLKILSNITSKYDFLFRIEIVNTGSYQERNIIRCEPCNGVEFEIFKKCFLKETNTLGGEQEVDNEKCGLLKISKPWKRMNNVQHNGDVFEKLIFDKCFIIPLPRFYNMGQVVKFNFLYENFANKIILQSDGKKIEKNILKVTDEPKYPKKVKNYDNTRDDLGGFYNVKNLNLKYYVLENWTIEHLEKIDY